MGVKAINLFKIGARRGPDVTAGAVAPILKRLIAVNTFVSHWGLRISGSDLCFCWGGGGVKAINLFKIGAHRGLDVTAGAVAPILKRLIAVTRLCHPGA